MFDLPVHTSTEKKHVDEKTIFMKMFNDALFEFEPLS